MVAEPEILGVPRKRWRVIYWVLQAYGLISLAVAVRLFLHEKYPISDGELYAWLYILAFIVTATAAVIAGLIGLILKAQPKE